MKALSDQSHQHTLRIEEVEMVPRASVRSLVAVAGVGLAMCLAACGASSGGASAPANCKPAHKFSTVAKGALTVVVADNPPVATTQNNKLGGFEGQLIKKFAQDNCLALRYKNSSFAASI